MHHPISHSEPSPSPSRRALSGADVKSPARFLNLLLRDVQPHQRGIFVQQMNYPTKSSTVLVVWPGDAPIVGLTSWSFATEQMVLNINRLARYVGIHVWEVAKFTVSSVYGRSRLESDIVFLINVGVMFFFCVFLIFFWLDIYISIEKHFHLWGRKVLNQLNRCTHLSLDLVHLALTGLDTLLPSKPPSFFVL